MDLATFAPVDTADGPVAACNLRPGSLVLTRDRGYRAVRWVGIDRDERPAIGIDCSGFDPFLHSVSARFLLHSRVVLAGDDVLALTGQHEALARVTDLAAATGAGLVPENAASVSILFDDCEIVRANSVWIASNVAAGGGPSSVTGDDAYALDGRIGLSRSQVVRLVRARRGRRATA